MRAKDLFRRCRDEMTELSILRDKREQLAYSLLPQAVRIKEISVQESGAGDQMADKIAAVADMDAEIGRQIERLMEHELEAYRIISQIRESRYRQILELYYLSFRSGRELHTWRSVADVMSYSEDRVKHLHGYALLAADKVSTI